MTVTINGIRSMCFVCYDSLSRPEGARGDGGGLMRSPSSPFKIKITRVSFQYPPGDSIDLFVLGMFCSVSVCFSWFGRCRVYFVVFPM